MLILKNILFVSSLIYAGYVDYKKRIIPDIVHLIVIIAAILTDCNFIKSIMGLIMLPIPFIAPILFDENSVGGGDIKLAGAIGFYFGITQGTIAVIIALTIAAILNLFYFKRGKKDSFPLAPYMAIGSLLLIFFNNLEEVTILI